MFCPIIEFAKQLIRCPSLSPTDAGCQDLIIKRLLAIGFTVKCINFDNIKNFWAWRGKGKTLVFAGHTDVVSIGKAHEWIYPPFQPVIKNGMLFGRGAADMKGSLAAMIIAAERFIAQYDNHRGRLAFLITSDEETNAQYGTVKIIDMLIANHERLDYCIIGEPSSSKFIGDIIKNGRRGSLTCNLTILGTQGHVAYPHLADNPIHHIIPMLNELVAIQWDRGNECFPPTSMQITKIQSGTENNNIIPGELYVQCNFRFNNEITDEIIKTNICYLLKKYQLKYTIDWWLSGRPFFTKHCEFINTVINAVTYFNHIKPQLQTTGGTSDGRFIALTGAQIVELGPINTTIHKVNECVNINDLQILSCIYQRIMEQLIS